MLFRSGTKYDTNFITSGGRVLNITGLASTIEEAQIKVYKAIGDISFEGMYYRRDIGSKALKFLSSAVK